jgi:hypothetical protein
VNVARRPRQARPARVTRSNGSPDGIALVDGVTKTLIDAVQ